MNAFIWSGFYSLIANLAIGVYVYSRRPSDRINQLFALFSFCIAFWSVGSFLANVIQDKYLALWMLRFNYLFGVWLPAFYLHFIYELFQRNSLLDQWKLRIAYSVSFLITPFLCSDLFIISLRTIPNTNFCISVPGIVYKIFFCFFSVSMIDIVRISFDELVKKSSSDDLNKFILLANLLAIMAGFEYFSRVFQILNSPPFDDYILIIYTFVIGFSIVRHNFLDVEQTLAIHREKLALIGIVSSSINHEIKNPLFLVREMVKKLGDSEEAKKISVQIDRMQAIVERLGNFARPAHTDAAKEELELREVIDNALFFANAELKYQNIKSVINIPNDLPKLRMDRSQLEVILLNLIINAYHAMPNGGELKIEARNDNGIKITISDTGIGIAKDELKNIFKPFYTTKQKTGTGLGLHIVKTLVEQNGGKISVESELGKGTRFYLIFRGSEH